MTEWLWHVDEAEEREKDVSALRLPMGEVIKQTLYQEQANWFLWLPVALGTGCAAYFALLVEPGWAMVLSLLLSSITFVILVRKHTLAFVFSIATLCIALGFSLAKLNSYQTTAPVIQKRIGPVLIRGRIETLVFHASGDTKIIVNPYEIERLSSEKLPRRLRLKLRKKQTRKNLIPGQQIEARAIIFPPPEPTYPGGFDFARKNWFDAIGGSGFFIDTPKILPAQNTISIFQQAAASLAQLRQDISARLKAQLGGDKGGLAAALIVGDRAAISRPMTDTLRDAGLAHLLAISGLHMVLFAGTIFWLVRALLALNATLILRWPVKKWAAGAALIGAVYYLAISGASIATQRAFIMISIMFLAVMLDRPAISLRNIAIAALIILVINPVSLLSISFQMSFAATTMLVAFYQWYRSVEVLQLYPSSSAATRMFYKIIFYIIGTALTTLIAGLATSPFAAYYFQRIAVFSLLTNVLALPVVGFVVMPAGLVALLLMPLGLEGYALSVMGAGLDVVIAIATWTSNLPNAVHITPAFSGTALLLMMLGCLWLCLWQTRWRLLGVGAIAAGLVLAPMYSLPDVYVSGNGRNIAVRGLDGRLVVAKSRREKYSVERWLIRDGDSATAKEAAGRKGFSCDDHGCIIRLKDNKILSFAEDLMAVEEDCTRVDILIATVPVRQKCERPSVVIDKFDLWRNGAYALNVSDTEIIVQNAHEKRGNRPWVRKRARRKPYDTKR